MTCQYASGGDGLAPAVRDLLARVDTNRSGALTHLEIIRATKLHPELRAMLRTRSGHLEHKVEAKRREAFVA